MLELVVACDGTTRQVVWRDSEGAEGCSGSSVSAIGERGKEEEEEVEVEVESWSCCRETEFTTGSRSHDVREMELRVLPRIVTACWVRVR